MSPTSRFVAAVLLIVAAAVFPLVHTYGEVFPHRDQFDTFPRQLGDWTDVQDIEIDQDSLEILHPSDYVERNYHSDAAPYGINLFISYYRSQRSGEGPHSPQHCLPGAGFVPIENTQVILSVPGHEPFPANRYVIAQGDARQLVLYWFWAHDRGVASEYRAKYYLIADSIKMNRSDGSLVRIITSMQPGESPDVAQQRLMPFVAQVVPILGKYIPR
jgi:EpsI family protein